MPDDSTQPAHSHTLTKTILPSGAVGIIGLVLGSNIQGDLPLWLQKMADVWGPAFLLLIVGVGMWLYYVPRDAVNKFLSAQQQQAVAMSAMATSMQQLTTQYNLLGEIKELLCEIHLDQRVIADRMHALEERRSPHNA